ncbi:transposase IS4 family protein [Candidatus Thiomargarita nelsonii]|uniref:Transposase IS4 family protein n=1 Tax=Candidatus Thiomargarita nelsonii TaxID=1003181 RepID=A0A176S273_9GAMM|nr:transposase IS4 family protein [Candidatus Thiomargarita nelsonii]
MITELNYGDEKMNSLKETLSQYWLTIQGTLFPWLKEELGDLTVKQELLITVLEILRIEEHLPAYFGIPGRPPADRVAIARAFVAKAVYDMPTTRILLGSNASDIVLHRIGGWEKKSDIPSESTFSRAFAEFAKSQLPQKVHEALIKKTYERQIVGHISKDATEIESREKPVKKSVSHLPNRSISKNGCWLINVPYERFESLKKAQQIDWVQKTPI